MKRQLIQDGAHGAGRIEDGAAQHGQGAAVQPIGVAGDVPPILSSTSVWSPIPYPKEIGREEAF
ncbi:hypothetical protein, partial [Xanthomonas arboricola]